MPRGRDWTLLITGLFLLDVVGVVGAELLTTALLGWLDPRARLAPGHAALMALVVPFAIISFYWQHLYNPRYLLTGVREFVGVLWACGAGLVALVVVSFGLSEQLPRRWAILAFCLAVIIVGIQRLLLRRLVQGLRRHGAYIQRALLVGADRHSISIAQQLGRNSSGVEVVGVLDDYMPIGSRLPGSFKVLGTSADLAAVAARTGAREVIIVPEALPWETLNEILNDTAAAPSDIRVNLSAGYYDLLTSGMDMYQVNHVPLMGMRRVGLSPGEAVLKRALDWMVASVLLILFAPLLLFAAARTRVKGVPLLVGHRAIGRRGQSFRLLSLPPEATSWVIVRKLPALLNVIRGQLSVVGPRPVNPAEGASGLRRARSLAVRPGLTGLWRQADDATEQALLDLYYMRNYSVWMDLHVLFDRTRARLWRRKSRPGQSDVWDWHPGDREVDTDTMTAAEAGGRASG
jgi:lipopolysaccharide/colanic/teichoic acid biosynthesis glycosyltransferase